MTSPAGATAGPEGAPGAPAPGAGGATEVLARGEITVHGRIAGSSNATLLVTCALEGVELLAVYKPVRGERELWDFPPGLHRREVAAYELARALGWPIVPETVRRYDAPFGEGSLQRVVAADDSHYFTVRDDERWHPLLKTMATFDVIANNADRKSGHVLAAEDTLWAIDHGLTFHVDDKLRTVIWDFAGEPLGDADAEALEQLLEGLPGPLAAQLDDDECDALLDRIGLLLAEGRLPGPGGGRPYPWPLV